MRVVLVPGVLALLPEYAGLTDPVADLRAACLDAVRWLGEPGGGIGVHGSPQGLRVARSLAAATGVTLDVAPERPAAVLVMGNGSARRTEKAPGHLDPRAAAFDDELGAALRDGQQDALGTVLADGLAEELLADVDGLRWLADSVRLGAATVDHDDDPFGVQYWVMRWTGEWR
ncbi:hypothetical protein H5V45_14590 [Nocardioides sp. KIGAM211]|uniref:Uncharacterized protein n=1 Tax=Nocardioides luti TaxID=2761101 RepID=A0A7X0RJR4_9ACTN|nr:hypothetical protein [Nocardioides luti]